MAHTERSDGTPEGIDRALNSLRKSRSVHEVDVASEELNSAIDEVLANKRPSDEPTTGLNPQEELEITKHLEDLGYLD